MSLLESLMGQLGGQEVEQIGRQAGVDSAAASKAISSALPLLVAALAKNSANPDGASALANALDRDHDGSVLNDLGGFLGNSGAVGGGEAILKHILGNKQQGAASAIGQMSGVDSGSAGKVLAMLAPVVLGALGKQRRQQGLDVGGLAGMLSGEKEQAQRLEPQGMGALGALLDADGDGDIKDDMTRIGMGMLGKMLGGRR